MSTQQLHAKTSTSKFQKPAFKKPKKLSWPAPEAGNCSYLVQRCPFSGWARCLEGFWWSSLQSLSGWLSVLLPSAAEGPRIKGWYRNKPIAKFLQHTMTVSKSKFQVIPGWRVWPGPWPWRCCTGSLQTWAAGWAPGPAEGFPVPGKTSW